jgi:hypothetical protein
VSGVGERAIAVCPRFVRGREAPGKSVLDCFGSQWAGSDERVSAVLGARSGTADPLLDCRWEHIGTCEPSTLRRGLDFLSLDAVYLVRPDGVSVYLPVWLGIPAGDGSQCDPADGVLVEVRSLRELRALRTHIRDLKGVFGVAVDRGLLSAPAARAALLGGLSVLQYGEPPAT